jgi:hypothetical protein
MLHDLLAGVSDPSILVSIAQQLRQEHQPQAEAIRALLEIARRRRAAGDVATATRMEALAAEARTASPWLRLADIFEEEAAELKRSPLRRP